MSAAQLCAKYQRDQESSDDGDQIMQGGFSLDKYSF
jgi:hypothetical protein